MSPQVDEPVLRQNSNKILQNGSTDQPVNPHLIPMASSNLILVCLIVAFGLVSAKPGFFPISSQQQLQRPHGGHLRQRIQEAIEEEQSDKSRYVLGILGYLERVGLF